MRVSPTPLWLVPPKKGTLDKTHREERRCEEAQGEDDHPQIRRKAWSRSLPPHPQKQPTLPTASSWTSSLHYHETIHFGLLSHPACGTLLWQLQKNEYEGQQVILWCISGISKRPVWATLWRIWSIPAPLQYLLVKNRRKPRTSGAAETRSATVDLICVLSQVQSSCGAGDLTCISYLDLPFLSLSLVCLLTDSPGLLLAMAWVWSPLTFCVLSGHGDNRKNTKASLVEESYSEIASTMTPLSERHEGTSSESSLTTLWAKLGQWLLKHLPYHIACSFYLDS